MLEIGEIGFARMERGEKVDFVRKPRTFSSRKPRSGGSHTFIDASASSPSGSPPNGTAEATTGFDKGLNDEAGKYSNHHSSLGDDNRKKLGNSSSNTNKGRFEMGKEDLGRSKTFHRRAGGGGDDEWNLDKDELKRVKRDVAEFSGSKHRSPEEDRSYDRKHDKGIGVSGSKSHDHDKNRRVDKPSREKSHRDAGHYEKDSKEDAMGGRERRFNGETFKRKWRAEDLDRLKRVRDGGTERKDTYDRHGGQDKSERDRDRDRNHDGAMQGHRLGGSTGRSHDGQGNVKASDGGSKGLFVGLSAAGGSTDWRNSDSHKAVDRKSSDAPSMSHTKGGSDPRASDAHGTGNTRLPDGRRADARSIEGHHMGHTKSANPEGKAVEGQNLGQVQTVPEGKSLDMRESLEKSTHRQDDQPFQENRLPKVKVKLAGVTHTLHANSTSNAGAIKHGSSASVRPPQAPEGGGRRRQRLILQENSDDEDDFPPRLESHKKEASVNSGASVFKTYLNQSREERRSKHAEEGISGKRFEVSNNFAGSQPVRKSSRIPKKRILDGEFDDDEDIEGATHHKTAKASRKRMRDNEYYDDREDDEAHQRKSSRIPKKRMFEGEDEMEDGAHQHKKKQKKARSGRESEDLYEDDEGEVDVDNIENSDIEHEARKKSKRIEGAFISSTDEKREAPLTARQRAMQSSKDADTEVGANLIEFPDGLPHSGQRKKKEKLTEVEIQLKKAEAAQRRKQQVEKAASAIQAEAIKKILGQDSQRKKREDRIRKQRDEKEQEKAASAMMLASNSVRLVMGQNGTVVSFPQDAGLPSIFTSGPCRYPPPREKCAGPSCSNTYKYRDSKSNLPLCSLQCYRAIHDATHPVSTC